MEVLISLSGEWYDENHKKWAAPFWEDERDELILHKDFFLPHVPEDTLYLYFEGIAWRGEVYLNQRLLSLPQDPFRELLLAIPPALLNKQWNQVKVKLYKNGIHYAWYPKKMLGIHKNVFLLKKGIQYVPCLFPKVVEKDTTLFYAPFSYAFAYNIEEEVFRQDMQAIKDRGLTTVYFPFPPSYRHFQIVAELGLSIAEKPGRVIAFYNAYPNRMGKNYPGWYNAGVVDSTHIQKYYKLAEWTEKPITYTLYLWVIIVLLILMVGWKLMDAHSFNHLILLQGRDSKANAEPANYRRWLLWYMLIIRILASSLILYFCYQLGKRLEYPIFDYFQENEDAITSSTAVFLKMLTLFTVYNLVKHFFLTSGSGIYKFSDLALKLMSVETRAVYPTNLLLLSSSFTLLVVFPTRPLWVAIIFGALAIAHILRKYNIIYNELSGVLKIPIVIIFLYICILELLPWLILL
jgi:hypothetical protein